MVQNVIPPVPALWLTALVGNRASCRLWLQASIRGALGHGERGWLWPTHRSHFKLFHFKGQSFVGDSCAVSYVFASCCWLHMFRAVVSCSVYLGSEKQMKML